MSYKEAKEKAARKRRKIRYILFAAIFFLAAGICVFSAFYPASTWKYYVGKPDVPRRKEGELKIHFLDVGQGDCTVLEFPDGKTMLIDGGNGESRTTTGILRYMNALKIKKPDIILLTHSDADHCGGLAEILKVKGASVVYAPVVEEVAEDTAFAAFYAALTNSDAAAEEARRYAEIRSDDERYPYRLVFLWPYGSDNPAGELYGGSDDDRSAVVWLDYSGTSALFCADAPEKTEKALMRDFRLGFFDGFGVEPDSTEILKVSHHGSAKATCEEFAKFLGVRTAVISCGKNNLYGHPSSEVLERLKGAGAEVYRTDLSGTVVATIFSDGAYRVDTQA